MNGIQNLAIKRDVSPSPFAICDVDGDGADDLLAQDQDLDARTWSVGISYGGASGWAQPVDVSKSVMTMVDANAPRIACWPSAYGPGKFVIGDPGLPTGDGFITPGTVWFYGIDAAKVPVLTRTQPNFLSGEKITGFSKVLAPAGDANGDGKPDLIIGYQLGFGGADAAWLLYGR
jgi:hypothetical protein